MILETISYAHLGHITNTYHQVVSYPCQCCSTTSQEVQAQYFCFSSNRTQRLCKRCAQIALDEPRHVLLLKNGSEYARYSSDQLEAAKQEARTLEEEGLKVGLQWANWD